MERNKVVKGIVTAALILAALTTSIGCGVAKKTQISLSDAVNIANMSRNSSKTPKNIQEYLYNYAKGDSGFSDDEVSMLTNANMNIYDTKLDEGKSITSAMAINDMDYLFKIFKYTYGGYQYFGGDKVFDKAKENIVNSLENEKELTVGKVEDTISANIDFIKDGHFQMDTFAPIIKYKNEYFYSENYEFYKDEKGYYTITDNKKYYLKTVEGNSKVSDYMKLTINKDGNVVYNIGMLQNELSVKYNLAIKLINGKKEINKDVSLSSSGAKYNNDIGFKKQNLNGIPIVKCTRMYDNSDNDTTCKLFGETGKELKNSPISIVDIRGNGGGDDMSSIEWFKGYTGRQPIISESSAQLFSKMFVLNGLDYADNMISNKQNISTDLYNYCLDFKNKLTTIVNNKDFNHWEVDSTTGSTVHNKNIVFVLVDNGVASSGETFVTYLRTLKNVVFVGTNTAGCGTISNNGTYKLPNTGICFYFGTGLTLENDFEEGTGFTPDLWVNSNDALDRVMKLISNSKKK